MPSDALHDAIYLMIEQTIEDNYRGADGSIPVSPSAVARLASLAALAAIKEEGMVTVSRADLDTVLNRAGHPGSIATYPAAMQRIQDAINNRPK